MINLTTKGGSPTTISIDYVTGTTDIYFNDPGHTDIFEAWKVALSDKEDITVALSGGLDSQFSALMTKQVMGSVKAATYEYMWEGSVVNAYDSVTARDFCKKHDIVHEIFQIDIKDFLDNKLLDYGVKYRTNSPQIAAQLYGTEHILNRISGHVMTGGDMPPLLVLQDKVFNPYDRKTRLPGGSYSPFKYKHSNGPFLILGGQYDERIIRDPFMMSPQVLYLAYKQIENIITECNVMPTDNYRDDGIHTDSWSYKQIFYKSFGFDYIMPLHKRTGFELIKSHLATKTGMYDEFDIRYRRPLEELLRTKKIFGHQQEKGVTNFNGECYQKLLKSLQCSYDTHQPAVPDMTYIFDW